MLFLLFIIVFIGVYLLSYIFIVYSPEFELIDSGSKYVVILWYNKQDNDGYIRRKYIKLFEL